LSGKNNSLPLDFKRNSPEKQLRPLRISTRDSLAHEPDVQRRIGCAIDAVVGTDDRDSIAIDVVPTGHTR